VTKAPWEIFQKTELDPEWDHPTINRPDISNALTKETYDADPHGIVPKGWVFPGQYKVECFLGDTRNDVLSLMVGIKYKNCTGRYSTSRCYIHVLQDYLARADYRDILASQDAWRDKRIKEFEEEFKISFRTKKD
jgi:hypothetical protein